MRAATCLLLFLSVFFHVGCGDSKKRPGDSAIPETGTVDWTDIGAAKFIMPKGWMGNRSDGNTVMILIREGADRQNPDEMISIDVGTPNTQNVPQFAEAFANKFSGSFHRMPFSLDGEEAFQVSVPPSYETIMPRESVVALHNGKAYMIIGGSKSQQDIMSTVYKVARSWRWK